MLAGVLMLLTLLHDGSSFHLPTRAVHLLHGPFTNSSMSKILGGSKAERGRYPFIVSLELLDSHICGGSVMSKNWVVTASHCVSSAYVRSNLVIRAGSMIKENGGTVHHIEQFVLHPAYNIEPMYDSDIALIKVEEPFTTNTYVKPVRLAKKKDIPDAGTDVVAAGWGVTTYPSYGDTSTDLLDVTLKIFDHEKCNTMPGMDRIREMTSRLVVINDNMLCAVAEHKDTTKGDSGGPLLKYTNESKEPSLVGIVSWGEGNGQLDSPGVYTNVASFIQWAYLETVTLPETSI